ncbi:OprO/OprP family phosphate-selective porin [Pendulispora rubella]|uniref:OprO/OprP family phosphate-selective porin n=1 Tax=Pendulispora rubella TaxID=2741070 RepID=A0ABZ2L426_9BACT
MKLMFGYRRCAQRRALSILFSAVSLTAACEAAAQTAQTGSNPQWSNAPTSSSGSELGAQPRAAGEGSAAPAASSDVDARMHALEAKVASMAEKEEKRSKALEWLEHVKFTGFIQPQLIWQWYNDAASPNNGAGGASGLPAGVSANQTIARPDGYTTNPDTFRIRRARLKVEATPTEYAKFIMEIDPFPAGGTASGIGTIARQIEAVAVIPWSKDVKTEIGVGIFKVPFGYEIIQSDADRPFIERSWSEQNLVPGEFDTGVRAYTTALDKKLDIRAAVVNGATESEKNFVIVPDLDHGKDLIGHVNYNFGPFDVGASGYYGHGSLVDATALKFKTYKRWAWNAEAAVHHKFIKSLGNTKLFSEFTRAQNLDRGLRYSAAISLPSIPSNINDDVGNKDEYGFFVRLEQDFSEWATLGLRYDVYTPDSAQKNNARDTYSLLAVGHFTKALQLMLEYDFAIDNVHRPGTEAPSKHIHTFSSVLQARF